MSRVAAGVVVAGVVVFVLSSGERTASAAEFAGKALADLRGDHHPAVATAHRTPARAPAGDAAAGRVAAAYAVRQLGEPYQLGAQGPDVWDCSGLVIRAWQSAGADWGDTTANVLGHHWPRIPLSAARPGDLLVFDWGPGSRVPGFDHVGMVVNSRQWIEAAGPPVRLRSLAGVHPSAVVRPSKHW